MNRILVIGCAGSGKSTLSRKLHYILDLPVIHLDTYFWNANWVPKSNEEWEYMPRLLCMYRIIKRRMMYHKKSRPDMNQECQEKLDWEFIKWVWNYRKRSRVNTIKKLEQVKGHKEVVILRTRKEVEEFIERLDQAIHNQTRLWIYSVQPRLFVYFVLR